MNMPPPIIDSAKLLYFATNDKEVEFTDQISLFVGDSEKEFKPIGEVSNLAILKTYYEPIEILLVFCNNDWSVLGVIAFKTIDEAKDRAEEGYRGIASKWNKSPYCKGEIENFLMCEYKVDPNSEWWTMQCCFCGRKDSEFQRMIKRQKVQICEICIREAYATITRG